MTDPRHAPTPVAFDEGRTGRGPAGWARGAGGPPRGFVRGVRAAGLAVGPLDPRVVTEADLAPLPLPVQRYLRFMGVLGRSRDWSVRAHLVGRFRFRVDRPWTPVDAWQYSSARELARLFRMRLNVGPLPVIGWDTYVRGRGAYARHCFRGRPGGPRRGAAVRHERAGDVAE